MQTNVIVEDCGHWSSCVAARKRITDNPNPVLRLPRSGSSASSSTDSSTEEIAKYPSDYWFWVLSFALPVGFSCRIPIIETFETVFRGKTVFDPDATGKGIWADPSATFTYIACELLVPTEPFGGFGGSKTVLFLGQKRTRNGVIAKIISVVQGKEFTSKQISSNKQTVIKGLLSQYADRGLGDYRDHVAVALHRLAGATPLREYFSSYLDQLPYHETLHGGWTHYRLKLAVRRLIAYGTVELHDNLGHQSEGYGNHFALHPFLAFFLGLNGECHMTADITSFVTCDTDLELGIASSRHGKNWWNRHVMHHSEQKAEYAKRWWANNLHDRESNERLHAAEFYREYGKPPVSDGGPFWEKYTPNSHQYRYECSHPRLADSNGKYKVDEKAAEFMEERRREGRKLVHG